MSLLRLTVGSSTTKRKCLATETVRCHPNEMHNLKAVPGFFWVQSAKESVTVPDMEICWSNVLSLAIMLHLRSRTHHDKAPTVCQDPGLGMEFTRLGSALASAYCKVGVAGWYWRDEHLKHLEVFLIWVFHVIPCYYSWNTQDFWLLASKHSAEMYLPFPRWILGWFLLACHWPPWSLTSQGALNGLASMCKWQSKRLVLSMAWRQQQIRSCLSVRQSLSPWSWNILQYIVGMTCWMTCPLG